AYGYELDGSSPRKALPVLDRTTERLDQEWQQAVNDYPEDATLWVNRGQFLLALARGDEARDCFRTALRLGGADRWARVGLGLVAYQRQEYAAALDEFEAVARLRPEDVTAQVNAAMCLEQLERTGEARPHWQRALDTTTDEALARRIRRHLEQLDGAPR